MATEQNKIRGFLDSVKESVRSRRNDASQDNNNSNNKNGNNNIKIIHEDQPPTAEMSYLNAHIEEGRAKNQAKSIPSQSTDTDDMYIDAVLNSKERRASWTALKTERKRSYLPSLTVICKLFFKIYFK